MKRGPKAKQSKHKWVTAKVEDPELLEHIAYVQEVMSISDYLHKLIRRDLQRANVYTPAMVAADVVRSRLRKGEKP